jgi:MerR family transcriptional regulator, thiopeptide resistance regulator
VKKSYQSREFALRAGVTVRALHHYDRLGLLKPSRRSRAGYRLYSDSDLIRLEQIVVLKSIGLPLKELGPLLGKDRTAARDGSAGLAQVLARQERVLADKRRQMDRAIFAVAAARRALEAGSGPDWTLFIRIIREIVMQEDTDWTAQYYSEEAKAKIEARRHLWSPELQERVTKQWNELYRDVEALIGEGVDPASERAQAIVGRWRTLIEGFTGGDPEIQKGLNRMYADVPNWPAERRATFQTAYGIRPEIQEYMRKAIAATG